MPVLNFIGDMDVRPRYHANDASKDVLNLDPQDVEVHDCRGSDEPSLDTCGFRLYEHHSKVADFLDPENVAAVYPAEMSEFLKQVTGADAAIISAPGLLRFGERSDSYDSRDNSRPARFVHIDISDTTAAQFAERSAPVPMDRIERWAHYNVWRVVTPPPQDVPLTVCDARTVGQDDLIAADAIFDVTDGPEWSFEGLVIRHNPQQRWCYYRDMNPDEVLVFRTNDSRPSHRPAVPHSAFDNPIDTTDVAPRVSIEARGICYWYR